MPYTSVYTFTSSSFLSPRPKKLELMTGMNYPNLLSPMHMGSIAFPNRVVMAPLTRGRSGPSGLANDMMVEYYRQRASAGFIISEGLSPSILGRGWFHAPDLFTTEHAQSWRKVTNAVHEAGGRIFAQPWHTGRGSHSSFREGIEGYNGEMKKAVAPSAIRRKSETGKQMYTMLPGEVDIETPRALSTEEVKALVQEYQNAAKMAKEAGFDGMEVHCANGYLLDEFLQSCSNQRTDQYGGSLENRFRLIDEIIRAVLTVFQPHQVGVRISPNGSFNGMGSEDFREAFLYYAKRIDEFRLGYLHIMIGLSFGFHGLGKPMQLEEFKDVYHGTIMANVGYDPESADKEIAAGNADLISFGRLYISNPDLVERLEAGAASLNEPGEHSVWWSTADNVLEREGYLDFQRLSEEEN